MKERKLWSEGNVERDCAKKTVEKGRKKVADKGSPWSSWRGRWLGWKIG